MPTGKFRVAINGFTCVTETIDDPLQLDGKRDEISLAHSVILKDSGGNTKYNFPPLPSATMGDVNNQRNRIQAGTASPLGGIQNGDSFPSNAPWIRTMSLSPTRNYPPYLIWEGDLTSGNESIFIAPSVWEWDPAPNLLQGLLAWHQGVDNQFGQQAKNIFSKFYAPNLVIFDAISLGIQTAATVLKIGSPVSAQSRPIGLKRVPGTAFDFAFTPYILVLTYDSAEYISNSNPSGRGNGIIPVVYQDSDPLLGGHYVIYLQVEKISGPNPFLSPQQGKYYSIQVASTGKHLDIRGVSMNNGARLQQYDRNGGANQQFTFIPDGNGYYFIKAKHSNKALDVVGVSKSDGAFIQQYDQNNGDNQRFKLVDKGNGWVQIQAKHSGKVFDIQENSMQNGATINQYNPHNGLNQLFRLV